MARLTLKASLSASSGTVQVRPLRLTVAVTISGPLKGAFVAGVDDCELEAELRAQLAPLEGRHLDDVVGRATLENIAAYLLVRLHRLRPCSVTVASDVREATVCPHDIDYPHFERELLFHRGTSLALRGHLALALAVYSDALALGPTARIFNARGRCRRRLGDLSGALDDFHRAIAADPAFGEAFRNRGNALLDLKRYDEALRDLTVAVEKMPRLALAWNNRGYALLCMEKPVEALSDHCRAIHLDPYYEEAYRDRVAALQALGRANKTQPDREMIAALAGCADLTAIERAKLEGCTASVAPPDAGDPGCVLLITPDFISHYAPLAAIGTEWRRRGYRVCVATGDKLRTSVAADGFEYARLPLGPDGIGDFLRTDSMSAGEISTLQESLRATAAGMMAAFKFQASHRESALLWHVDEIFRRLGQVIGEVRPVFILSVQLAYNATAALLAHRARFATLVTGHPAQVPATDEVYGVPYQRPARFTVPAEEISQLEAGCREVQDRFTLTFNRFVQEHCPSAVPVRNALAAGSPWLTLHNYPAEFASAAAVSSTRVHFVGPVVRRGAGDLAFESWYGGPDPSRPLVVVSFGSFFAVRADLLLRLASALATIRCRVAMAVGDNDVRRWNLPSDWYVVPFLRQQAIMHHADLVVFHGGNNTFLEALNAGVPMLVGPICSDQFAIAADVERLGLGFAFDPNLSLPEEIRALALRALDARLRAVELAAQMRKSSAALTCDLMACLLGPEAA